MTRIAEIAARVADPAYYPACPGPKADIAYLLSLMTRIEAALNLEEVLAILKEAADG